MAKSENPLRNLPAVNELLETAELQAQCARHARSEITAAVRAELDELRQLVRAGGEVDGQAEPASIIARVVARLERENQPNLRRVINATGIVLHTNLGRAPMGEAAARAAYEAASGYLNLELDLAGGKRSSRQDAVRNWVCRLTGAEAATAVNNNAAATVIALRALCQGKEVVLSRGQLIEIGGSFRIPDIMSVSGATLREVGTTNITRLADYERAVGPETAALMTIHTSNYRVAGFTRSVELPELVALGRKHNLIVIDDIGSGAQLDFNRFGLSGEPIARDSIAAGADLVLFSGDKLLGGPQAGILAGKKEFIARIEKDPLMRAFRLDKMTLAALEATLRLYLDEERALREVPVLRMLNMPRAELRQRAEALAVRLRALSGLKVRVSDDHAFVGGGSLPDQAMETSVLEVEAGNVSDQELARRLRTGTPAVMGRLRDGKLVLDPRTIFVEQEDMLTEAVRQALTDDPGERGALAP